MDIKQLTERNVWSVLEASYIKEVIEDERSLEIGQLSLNARKVG